MRGPKPEALSLSDAERSELEVLVRRHGTAQQHALRGRMMIRHHADSCVKVSSQQKSREMRPSYPLQRI